MPLFCPSGRQFLGDLFVAPQRVPAGLSLVSGDQLKKAPPYQLYLLPFSTLLSVPLLFPEITSKTQPPTYKLLSQTLLSGRDRS